jgi:arginyl-tRNA synthetase
MLMIPAIQKAVAESLAALYQFSVAPTDVSIQETKPEFEGDYTVVLFGWVKALKMSPDQLGQALGNHLVAHYPDLFVSFQPIKGFLNLSLPNRHWISVLESSWQNPQYGQADRSGKRVMVEYSSPNTNKPLHLGHLRNNFLGWSVAEILKANGHDVIKSCVVNDRGIHICKSMIAWQRYGQGATPESTGIKGDHFVGDYYVKFNEVYKAEVNALIESGLSEAIAEKEAPIMQATQQMLIDWEAGKSEVIDLWKTMNQWVYAGFDQTYQRIGSDFDKTYYESETYLPGKEYVLSGLKSGVFFQKPDGSIWIDLHAEGLDEKLVLRKDGTSVYMTQDLGLAQQKAIDYQPDESIYVIGDEQNYHMNVLKQIALKLQIPHAEGIHHLSYGMVELPTGKMKSREGTVVDADDLVDEMIHIAATHTREQGKVEGFTEAELTDLYDIIGIGALKFYLLRVDPKKKMVFNPEESIDFHGYTGPFIQYTYARIQSILRKNQISDSSAWAEQELLPLEKKLIFQLDRFPGILKEAGQQFAPSIVADYAFHTAKLFNSFYAEHSIAKAESEEKKALRMRLAQFTATVLRTSMQLLGARVPERM